MRRRLLGLPLLLPAALLAACSGSITAAPDTLPRVQVDSARLLRNVGALAHDSMEGRGTGTPGGVRARQLLVQQLTAAGVPALGAMGHELATAGQGSVQAIMIEPRTRARLGAPDLRDADA